MSRPIGDDELGGLFSTLAGLPRIGVAVSGGPDSTALFWLLHRWASRQAPAPTLHLLTVDHGLRPEAAAEAADVAAWAQQLGHPADVLRWQHDEPRPAADIQAKARTARYRLLAEKARELDLTTVLLAHTLDDQAETFLMRLERGSGVTGLAGMASERMIGGMRFQRPLLQTEKSRLIATLDAAKISFVEDPSNDADRFLRVRMRKLMPQLAAAGIDARNLADTARRLSRASAALDVMTDRISAEIVTDHDGVYSLDLAGLGAAPEEIALRLLARLIQLIRPAPYPPRAAPLEAWIADLRNGQQKRRTMAGVTLDPRPDRLWIYAEAGRSGFPILDLGDPAAGLVWDGRYSVVVGPGDAAGLVIAAADLKERRDDIPKAAAASLPVVRAQADRTGPAPDILLKKISGIAELG